MTDSVYVKFGNLSRPLLLNDCRQLVEHLPLILPGWKFDVGAASEQTPIISISLDRQGKYTLKAEWLDEPTSYRDEVDTICALVAKLIKARTLEDMDLLCLHGAAVEIEGRLIIFPNKYRAGKSVLSACMAAAGYRVFSDDVLPISLADGQGIAPAIAPRLRYPYPENLNPQTSRFIEARAALKGERYHYLDLRPELLAGYGSKAPIGAFVFLERAEGAETELQPIAESEVLRQVVWQNFAREVYAPSILSRLGQVVTEAQRFTLRYDRADDAVVLLADTFRRPTLPETSSKRQTIELHNTASGTIEVPAGHLLRRNSISEIKSDNDAFLADATGAAIHHLNPIGSAIWNLLGQPITFEQITELLLVAFPDARAEQVESDVRKLIKTLKAKNLILSGPCRVGDTEPG